MTTMDDEEVLTSILSPEKERGPRHERLVTCCLAASTGLHQVGGSRAEVHVYGEGLGFTGQGLGSTGTWSHHAGTPALCAVLGARCSFLLQLQPRPTAAVATTLH